MQISRLLLLSMALGALSGCVRQTDYDAHIQEMRLWINGDPAAADVPDQRGLQDWLENVARAVCNIESYLGAEQLAGNLGSPLPDPNSNTQLCGSGAGPGRNGAPPNAPEL